jgi:hypothetical protein
MEDVRGLHRATLAAPDKHRIILQLAYAVSMYAGSVDTFRSGLFTLQTKVHLCLLAHQDGMGW